MAYEDELDPDLKQKLDQLRHVPQRGTSDAARARAVFLNKAAQIAEQPVSGAPNLRHKKWLGKQPNALKTGKEKLPVMGTVTAILLALALFFGGAGGTVYASQSSLPGEALYPVKTFGEDVRNWATVEPQAAFDYNLDLADLRIAEMVTLIVDGTPVPEPVVLRLQEHLDTALQRAADLEDDAFKDAVLQLKIRLEIQSKSMNQVNINQDPQGEALSTMAQNVIRERIRLVEEGQESPVMLQQKLQDQNRLNQDQAGQGAQSGQDAGNQAGQQAENAPGQGPNNGQGGQPESVPLNGSQADQAGQGPADGAGNQLGQGASGPGVGLQRTLTPMPQEAGQGSGYGKPK